MYMDKSAGLRFIRAYLFYTLVMILRNNTARFGYLIEAEGCIYALVI